MEQVDFPTWLAVGSYGGLVFSLLVAAGIAGYALRLRRGSGRQLARTMLVCLLCSCLMFAPIWWTQTRFGLLGPTLTVREVGFWLIWTALVGWSLPLGAAVGYTLLAAPQPVTGAVPVLPSWAGLPSPPRRIGVPSHPAALDDPGRQIEPLGAGRAWGQLVPLEGPFAQRAVPLTRQLSVLGREADCDIVVPDDRASRYHAELRWDHGHVQLVDCGSMNGTRVNGQAILGQAPLHGGDVVEIGSQRYRFEQMGALPGARSPSPPDLDVADETHKLAGSASRTTPPTGIMLPTLALVLGTASQPGQRWELVGPITTIGRDPGCEVCIPDPSVSRRHAQIVRQLSGLYVQDLDSQNGTLLNGQLVTSPSPLRPGDALQLGEVILRCEPSRARPVSGPRVAASSNPAAPALADAHARQAPQQRAAERPHLAPSPQRPPGEP